MASIDGRACVTALIDLEAGIINNASHALRASVQAAESSARGTRLFNDVSGKLRGSIVGISSGLEGELRANAPYAAYIENGTPPHRIEARGKALRFVQNGEVHFASGVNHPGTAERPFMDQAAKVGEQSLDHGLDYFTNFAIERFNS